MISPSYFIKNTTVTNIGFFRFHSLMTIGKFFLLEVFMHICLPQSLTDLTKFAASLSQCMSTICEGQQLDDWTKIGQVFWDENVYASIISNRELFWYVSLLPLYIPSSTWYYTYWIWVKSKIVWAAAQGISGLCFRFRNFSV